MPFAAPTPRSSHIAKRRAARSCGVSGGDGARSLLPVVHALVAGEAEASLWAGDNGKAARLMQQSSTTWEVVAAGELSRRKLRGSSPALHEVVILLLVADIF